MEVFKRSRLMKRTSTLESSKPYLWQEDEKRVREATCSFQVKYHGCMEVFESRGIQICEDAVAKLKNGRRGQQQRAILYVSGDALKVVDELSKGLIVDQTIEKVSFCAPDRHNERAFAYICRDGTTRRWMCHVFFAIKESGERLSHAVGCAFTICLERKQQREKEKAHLVASTTLSATAIAARTGSFRAVPLRERLADPQSAIVAAPVPVKTTDNPFAIARPHARTDLTQNESYHGFKPLLSSNSSPFKSQIAVSLKQNTQGRQGTAQTITKVIGTSSSEVHANFLKSTCIADEQSHAISKNASGYSHTESPIYENCSLAYTDSSAAYSNFSSGYVNSSPAHVSCFTRICRGLTSSFTPPVHPSDEAWTSLPKSDHDNTIRISPPALHSSDKWTKTDSSHPSNITSGVPSSSHPTDTTWTGPDTSDCSNTTLANLLTSSHPSRTILIDSHTSHSSDTWTSHTACSPPGSKWTFPPVESRATVIRSQPTSSVAPIRQANPWARPKEEHFELNAIHYPNYPNPNQLVANTGCNQSNPIISSSPKSDYVSDNIASFHSNTTSYSSFNPNPNLSLSSEQHSNVDSTQKCNPWLSAPYNKLASPPIREQASNYHEDISQPIAEERSHCCDNKFQTTRDVSIQLSDAQMWLNAMTTTVLSTSKTPTPFSEGHVKPLGSSNFEAAARNNESTCIESVGVESLKAVKDYGQRSENSTLPLVEEFSYSCPQASKKEPDRYWSAETWSDQYGLAEIHTSCRDSGSQIREGADLPRVTNERWKASDFSEEAAGEYKRIDFSGDTTEAWKGADFFNGSNGEWKSGGYSEGVNMMGQGPVGADYCNDDSGYSFSSCLSSSSNYYHLYITDDCSPSESSGKGVTVDSLNIPNTRTAFSHPPPNPTSTPPIYNPTSTLPLHNAPFARSEPEKCPNYPVLSSPTNHSVTTQSVSAHWMSSTTPLNPNWSVTQPLNADMSATPAVSGHWSAATVLSFEKPHHNSPTNPFLQ